MAYYLGIDGGGTKTRCLLGDETTVLGRAVAGGSNIVRLGEAQAREALHTVIRQVCAVAKISPAQIDAVRIGAAGAARPEIAAMTRRIIAELIGGTSVADVENKIEVAGDTEIALEAAFGDGAGVIAIAGTGSVVYGRDANGRIARAGGWGFAVSDEGSGHWIGRNAISALLKAHDQSVVTTLTPLVLQAWKLDTIDELVRRANATPPPDFPRIFPVVLRAADEGDTVASDLLAEAGAELARLAVIVIRRLTKDDPEAMLPVATTGSVFRQSQIVRRVFYNQLQTAFPGIDVHQEPVDPVEGALAGARAMRG
jgi:glucosamine kinase